MSFFRHDFCSNLSVFKRLQILLVGGLLFGLWGCPLPEDEIAIFPPSGSSDVPMNAIVEIFFEHAYDLSEKDLHKSLFSFATCPKGIDPNEEPSTEDEKEKTASTAPTPKKKSTDPDSETKGDGDNATSSTALNVGNQVPFHLAAFSTLNRETQKNELRAYLIPRDAGGLTLGETYCVGVTSFEVPEKALTVQGLSSQFTVKTKPHFHFQNQSKPETITQSSLRGQEDYIVLYFAGSNNHVSPDALQKSITVCEEADDTSQASSGPCKNFGKRRGFELYLRESLKSSNEDQYLTASYNLYAIKPIGLESETSSVALALQTNFSNSGDPTGGVVEETFTQQGEATGPATLKEIEVQADRTPRFEEAFIHVATEK